MKNNQEDSPKKQGEDMSVEKTNQDYNKQKPDPKDPNQIKEDRKIDIDENNHEYEELPIEEDENTEESIDNNRIQEIKKGHVTEEIEKIFTK